MAAKIRKGDKVIVLSGRDKGRTGEVFEVRPAENKALVRGINMVSAAEQLAANLNFGALAKADELKKRIWFTLGALLVYRLGTYIPLPGIDPAIWEQVFKSQAGGILGMVVKKSGPGAVTAGDIQTVGDVVVLNPDLQICTLDEGAEIRMNLPTTPIRARRTLTPLSRRCGTVAAVLG